jgi:predicted TIM-barrel fold metal-dependent hydrolase
MDEAYRKHHFWVRPKLDRLPSEYFRSHGFASFQEDPAGLELAERHGLSDCLMWGNDYPHQEGVFPDSQEWIEKQFAGVPEAEIMHIVHDNAAKVYGFAV